MSGHSIAKKLYVTINAFEAKLAKLTKYQISITGLDFTYLSNVELFTKSKPVLLLLHGFSGDKYVWNRLVKYFTTDYQLLIPDLKGHGESAYSQDDDYSVPAQCTALFKLLDELNIDKFHVVGNSMGGMIAANFIEQTPERIDKCVLIDPAGARSQFVAEIVENNTNPFAFCTEADFFEFYNMLMAKPPFMPQFILRALAQDYIQKSAQHAHMFAQFYSLDDFFPANHRFIFSNTMLIWGLNDKLLPIEDYQHWKNILCGSTCIYEDLGHLPMLEDAKRVAKDILVFLRSA